MNTPIPDRSMPSQSDSYSILNSRFVDVKKDGSIDVRMMYAERGMTNATEYCLVRREVLDKLKEVQATLPDGISLRIWDAWRPFALQKELFDYYSETISKQFNLTELTHGERIKFISKYVSIPNFDKLKAPVHTTGGAVDVTLIDSDGNELDMGTEFDSFSERTHTNYFELTGSVNIRDNRRILYNSMINAGFTNLPSEWWHYDFGDGFWSSYSRLSVIYEGVADLKEVGIFE